MEAAIFTGLGLSVIGCYIYIQHEQQKRDRIEACYRAGNIILAAELISRSQRDQYNPLLVISRRRDTPVIPTLVPRLEAPVHQIRSNASPSTLILSSRINYRAHEILDPAPQVTVVSGPLTIEKIMPVVRSQPYASEIESMLKLAPNLSIWDRVFIHDRSAGRIDIRTHNSTDGSNQTICLQV
jgi:hypothetical protein